MQQPTSANPAAARRKLVLIAVLGVVLIGVIVSEYGGATPAPQSAASTGRPGRRTLPKSAVAEKSAPVMRESEQKPWPRIALEEVLQYDPFRPLATLTQVAPDVPAVGESGDAPQKPTLEVDLNERRQRALAALGDHPPTLVFTGTGGGAITFRDRTFRIGDQLGDFRIVEITPAGVVLEDLRN
jgi:hypothetical protein